MHNILRRCEQTMDWMLHVIYPKRCPFCDELIFQSIFVSTGDVCIKCIKQIEYIKEPVCKKCGKPILSDAKEKCFDCEKTEHKYVQGKALFVYKGLVKDSIFRYKYKGRREYANFYGQELVKYYGKWILSKNIDVVIPIPLHKNRKRQRGFNQAEDLAKVIGKMLEIPVNSHILKRIIDTKPQKKLNSKDRKNNLKKAFKIIRNKVQLTHILLVDDIYTTGNTIDEVARTLINSGAECVYYISISIGKGYEEERKWM